MTINPAWFAAGGACAAGGLLAWGALAPGSQLFGRTLRRLDDTSSMAITFDDGPNPAVTPRVLEILARQNATATFFLIGQRVRAFPGLAREIAERGHALGNHTETHPPLTFLSAGRIGEELRRCDCVGHGKNSALDTAAFWLSQSSAGFNRPAARGGGCGDVECGGEGLADACTGVRDSALAQGAWRGYRPVTRWRSSRAGR